MLEIVYIAAAGGLGVLGRYHMSGLVHRLLGEGFPYGTLAVKVTGPYNSDVAATTMDVHKAGKD